jgi:transposase-like protein
MAHPPEKRLELRAAYIGGLPLEAAADKAGVPAATARNWYRAAREEGDDWDKFRAASLIVAGGGIEQAMGRIIAAGLMRCEALLERFDDAADPVEAVKAMATLGDTVAKLKAAGRMMMPEADRLAIETAAVKALSDLFVRLHPKSADRMLSTVEAWANGQR